MPFEKKTTDVPSVVLPYCYIGWDKVTGQGTKEHVCSSSGQFVLLPYSVYIDKKKRELVRKATPAEVQAGRVLSESERDKEIENPEPEAAAAPASE